MQAQSALRTLILNMDDYRKIRADLGKSGGTVQAAFAQREALDVRRMAKLHRHDERPCHHAGRHPAPVGHAVLRMGEHRRLGHRAGRRPIPNWRGRS
jgi:hypothetical protein